MLDISLHLLDLLQNCANAGATCATVEIAQDSGSNLLTIAVSDNGRGMELSEQERAMDPFYSTKGKRTGLGIPMIAQAARMAGGEFHLESSPGHGTRIRCVMEMSNVDRQPMGDLVSTAVSFLAGNPHVNLVVDYRGPEGRKFVFDTCSEFPLSERKVLGQIGFLSQVEERLRAGLALAGFLSDEGGARLEIPRRS